MLTLPASFPLIGLFASLGACVVLCFAIYIKFFRFLPLERSGAPHHQRPPKANLKVPPSKFIPEPLAHQIIPRVWLGSSECAQDYTFLKSQNITHILNVAGTDSQTPELEQVSVRDLHLTRLTLPIRDLRSENILKYFAPCFSFINSALEENDSSDVRVFIPDSTSSDTVSPLLRDDSSLDFPQSSSTPSRSTNQTDASHARGRLSCASSPSSRPGAVLVHCVSGISRSPTIVIAYMMQRWRRRLVDAYITVKAVRSIIKPNRGFLSALISFELELFSGIAPTTQHDLALAAYKLEAVKLRNSPPELTLMHEKKLGALPPAPTASAAPCSSGCVSATGSSTVPPSPPRKPTTIAAVSNMFRSAFPAPPLSPVFPSPPPFSSSPSVTGCSSIQLHHHPAVCAPPASPSRVPSAPPQPPLALSPSPSPPWASQYLQSLHTVPRVCCV
eukprot:gnl/Spiro4/29219_TR14289_c0_g1_i2.p1 gnl/Spiro4/29219_TR14289_c0_g1~~gnl/Spiro4/29219_TR14289_c0_g1_i2.p1  ORF type:complete len:514 (+),score=95.11 gnl/Spiro4/29219_TR14289_c0_g1_i2:209-1543(+)